ncbi:MAG: DUF4272 domain-containing protein [Planctomycetota bacterium]
MPNHAVLIAVTLCLAAAPLSLADPTPRGDASTQARRQIIEQRRANPSPEALERKARSNARLRDEGVPVNEHLPARVSVEDSTRRTAEEVALRAMALCVVAVKGEGLEQEIVDMLVQEYRLQDVFSPEEARFIANPNPTRQDRVQMSWRYENYWTMLWALGFVDTLEKPTTLCNVPLAVTILQEHGRDGFLAKAKLRPQAEILDEADLVYRYNWAVVDARVNDREPPADLERGVVYERHYALNWLIGYADQAWDHVTTDT